MVLKSGNVSGIGAFIFLALLLASSIGCPQSTDSLPADVVLNNKGIQYAKKGMFDEAIAEYTKAIQINPNASFTYINRGNAYYSKGSVEQAISDFGKAIEIDENALAYYSRSWVYYNEGQYDKSWEDLHRARELGFPADPKFIRMLQDASGRDR